MPWLPTLLEDSLDPWLAVEADPDRRRAVIDFLIDLCEAAGHADDEQPVPGTQMPAFAALVPNQDVVIVWVIAEAHQQLAIRYLYTTCAASSSSVVERTSLSQRRLLVGMVLCRTVTLLPDP